MIARLVLQLDVFEEDGVYWAEIGEMPGLAVADDTLPDLLRKVADVLEETGAPGDSNTY